MATTLDPEVEEPRVYKVILIDLWEFYVTISDLQALGFQAIAVQAPPIMSRIMRIEPADEMKLSDILPGLDLGQDAGADDLAEAAPLVQE
jgi:hypothetical protein